MFELAGRDDVHVRDKSDRLAAASDSPNDVGSALFFFVVRDFHPERLNAASDDLFAEVLVAWRVDGVLPNEVADYPDDLVAVDVFRELRFHGFSRHVVSDSNVSPSTPR